MRKTGNDFSHKVSHAGEVARHYRNDFEEDCDDRCLTAYALVRAAAELWSDGTRHSHEIAQRAYVLGARAHRDYLNECHPELVG